MMTHRRLQTALKVGIGLILVAFLMARLDWLPLPRLIFFTTVVLFILGCSLWWWSWGDSLIIRLLPPVGSGTREIHGRLAWLRPVLRLLWLAHLGLVLSPLAFSLAGARDTWDALPPALLGWVYVWHMLMVVVVSLITIGWWLLLMPRMVWRRRHGDFPGTTDRERDVNIRQDPEDEESPAQQGTSLSPDSAHTIPESAPVTEAETSLTRRQILSASLAAAPLVIVGGSVGRSMPRQGRFVVNRIDLALPHLPERLRGFTIAHVSDFHVGRFFRPEHLPALVEATNALKSDLVAVTGDILDHDIDYLPETCDAIAQFESRFGSWLVAGNHDLIDSPQDFLAGIDQRSDQFHALHDRRVNLVIDGEELQLAGLFWSRNDEPLGRDPGHRGRVESTLGDLTGSTATVSRSKAPGSETSHASDDGRRHPFTLALAHHPHSFDYLARHGVDLTLAGHTHGGQLMLPRRVASVPLGLGNLLFRYLHGTYWRNGCALYVNAGVGNWFPVRLNAPAEIVRIRLV